MAAVCSTLIVNAVIVLEGNVEAEHPNTANYNPHEEKCTQEALTEVPAMPTIFPLFVFAAFILAKPETAFENVDSCLKKTDDSEHY